MFSTVSNANFGTASSSTTFSQLFESIITQHTLPSMVQVDWKMYVFTMLVIPIRLTGCKTCPHNNQEMTLITLDKLLFIILSSIIVRNLIGITHKIIN
jgi:hypothetical protein